MIRAEDFAFVREGLERNIPFGISKERSVAALRRLADAIEAEVVWLGAVELKGTATKDDFSAKTLVLEYHEMVTQSNG